LAPPHLSKLIGFSIAISGLVLLQNPDNLTSKKSAPFKKIGAVQWFASWARSKFSLNSGQGQFQCDSSGPTSYRLSHAVHATPAGVH
jgi:hypothetical protein